jgi:cobalamin transport system substrate-binding protein
MKGIILILALALAIGACSPGAEGSSSTTIGTSETVAGSATTTTTETTTTGDTQPTYSAFPAVVSLPGGDVRIEAKPTRVVSLSSTATEMLYAIGAGDQVIAVDEFSTYPDEAPVTDLSGFGPNLEAILGYEPDLVVISFDPGELQTGLTAVGVPSMLLPTALTLQDSYDQIHDLGVATGHSDEAEAVAVSMKADITRIVEVTPVPDGLTFYHEVDSTLYAASSFSFLGQIYDLLAMENIADPADTEGIGFPQLSSEYIVSKDPDLIFLADVDYGVTPESLAERPGWDGMTAVANGAIIPLESYLASNWGPRVVDLLQTIADSVTEMAPVS